MKYKANLIYDLGFHKCEDIEFYLFLGYNVVGIDADMNLVNEATQKYKNEIDAKKLIIEHCAITENRETEVEFFRSANTAWNSVNKDIATRKQLSCYSDKVRGEPLLHFFQAYGIPYYCKIDIEGNDLCALKSLSGSSNLPRYISVETECLGEQDNPEEGAILATLMQLYELGYRKFKLIDQLSYKELQPREPFYNTTAFTSGVIRQQISDQWGFCFQMGSSGPFGEYLFPNWLTFENAVETLLFHRKHFFESFNQPNYAFWCDWHATQNE